MKPLMNMLLLSMLHLELLHPDSTEMAVGDWLLGTSKAPHTLDATPYLLL
jgi:hypothetical protein